MTKLTHGGQRKNAGRKEGEKKVALGIRVPVQHKERLIAIVKNELFKIKNAGK